MTIKNNQPLRVRFVIGAIGLLGVMALGGCDTLIYEGNPTQLVTGRAETYRDQFALEKNTAAISDGDISRISRDYWSRGESPLQLMVTYDPHSKTNTAMKASQNAERISGMLRAKSVKNIETEIMPVQDSGDTSTTLIAYDALNARPPSECDRPMDMDFADQSIGEDYKLGCSVHTYVSRQIARPKDLLGQDDMDNWNGRMISNSLDPYMSGTPNAELKGEVASEN